MIEMHPVMAVVVLGVVVGVVVPFVLFLALDGIRRARQAWRDRRRLRLDRGLR